MKSKVLFLFDKDEHLKRNPASEEDFKSEFSEIYYSFFKAYEKAFEKMLIARSQRKPNEMTKLFPSDTIRGYLYSELKKNNNILPFLREKYSTIYLETSKYKLCFKKIDQNYKAQFNQKTTHGQQMYNNLSSSKDDLRSVIIIGYQVDSTWSELLGVYAVNWADPKKLNWAFNIEKAYLENITGGKTINSIPLVKEDKKLITTKPKIKLKKGIKRKNA